MRQNGHVWRFVVVLLLVVGLYRLTLLDRGTSAFVDETLYFASVTALDALRAGDVAGAAKQITVARGRQLHRELSRVESHHRDGIVRGRLDIFAGLSRAGRAAVRGGAAGR
jgi:hypothetical protein